MDTGVKMTQQTAKKGLKLNDKTNSYTASHSHHWKNKMKNRFPPSSLKILENLPFSSYFLCLLSSHGSYFRWNKMRSEPWYLDWLSLKPTFAFQQKTSTLSSCHFWTFNGTGLITLFYTHFDFTQHRTEYRWLDTGKIRKNTEMSLIERCRRCTRSSTCTRRGTM